MSVERGSPDVVNFHSMSGGIVEHIRLRLLAAIFVLIASATLSFNLFAFDIDVGELRDEVISIQEAQIGTEARGEATAEGEAEDGWREYGSEEGDFGILFPGEPSYRHHVRDTAFGDIEENIYEFTDDEGGFSAEYTDLPTLISLLATNRMIFRRAKDALLEEFKGKEIYFVNVKHDKLGGRELGFETKTETGIARFYMKKKRLYVLVATVPKKGGDATNISKFIDSFELMKVKRHKPHKYIDMRQTGKR